MVLACCLRLEWWTSFWTWPSPSDAKSCGSLAFCLAILRQLTCPLSVTMRCDDNAA
jgi:hypothetical protein